MGTPWKDKHNQCWAVLTGGPSSQSNSHIVNQLFSFWMKTGLKTGFKVLTHVRTATREKEGEREREPDGVSHENPDLVLKVWGLGGFNETTMLGLGWHLCQGRPLCIKTRGFLASSVECFCFWALLLYFVLAPWFALFLLAPCLALLQVAPHLLLVVARFVLLLVVPLLLVIACLGYYYSLLAYVAIACCMPCIANVHYVPCISIVHYLPCGAIACCPLCIGTAHYLPWLLLFTIHVGCSYLPCVTDGCSSPCVDIVCLGTYLTLLCVVAHSLPCVIVACSSPCVASATFWGVVLPPLPPPYCHMQVGAWSARLGKKKRVRFCFDVFGFV